MLDSQAVIVVPIAGTSEVKVAEGLFVYLTNGWCKQFKCVIAADASLGAHDVWKLVRGAKAAFADVQVVQPPFAVEPARTANWLINAVVVLYSKRLDQELCVLPPNCMPIQKDWHLTLYSGERHGWKAPVAFRRPIRDWVRILASKFQWFEWCSSKGVLILNEGDPILDLVSYHPKVGVLAGKPITAFLESLVRPRVASKNGKEITFRRWAAIGDVIASTGIARKLTESGYRVKMVTFAACAEALLHSPHVVDLTDTPPFDFDLDTAYEKHPDKAFRHINDIFTEVANRQLEKRGIVIQNVNYAPTLIVTPVEQEVAYRAMKMYPRPWVVVCPRSNMAARTLPPQIIAEVARGFEGTLFLCSDLPAPHGVVDLKVKRIRNLMAYISMGDIILSVDSAPLHIAAGLKKTIVAIRQSFDPALRISDQRDYTIINRTDLDCLPCNEYMCRLNHEAPPCGILDPGMIRDALTKKLSGIFGGTVSAIIPVYKPDIARLNRCLTAILPQVNQVVIGIDGGVLDESVVVKSPKIKFVSHFSKVRRGYGKTCNLAARESFGRFLLMLNDDCFANPEMVRRLLIEMEDEKTAVVGCLLRYPDGRIQHGGTFRNGMSFGHLDHLKTETTIKAPRNMEWVTFASAIIRRDVFFAQDGFDERFDCYGEDSDLCLRIGFAGWKIRYTPHASAIHQESMTTSHMKSQLLQAGNATMQEIWKGKL
jgi:GT2 family glycosyltransferase/ADP-heptose:LPS heptosyltransferase